MYSTRKPINVFATPTGQNSASFDWSAGNPSGSPVITYYWVVGTSPSVTYGNGVAQGSLLGNWASTNALQPNTMYYLRVFAKSSCNNQNSDYSTSAPFTTSGYPCIQPGIPQYVYASPTGPNSAGLDWSVENPLGSPLVTYFWVVGTSPSVTFGNGIAQGSTNNTWVSTNALNPNTTYYLRVYAISSCNNVPSAYGTSPAFTTSGTSCITPGKPINVFATPTGQNSASFDWSAGNPSGSPVITYYWVVGTSPSVTYGNGVAQGSLLGNWASTNALQPNTMYYLRVFTKSSCNNQNSDYSTSAPFTTSGSCAPPSIQSSNIYFSMVSTQKFTVSWTIGNGKRSLVKINTSNTFTPPANGTDPVADNNYLGTGEQVVYNGTGNSVTITGLPLNSTLWIRVYEANCSGTYTVYNISPSISNPSSQQTITVVPAMFSFNGSTAGLNSNNQEVKIPFYTLQNFERNIPLMELKADGSSNTRFILHASNAIKFAFRLVDTTGIVVSDGVIALNPSKYGRLGSPIVTAQDMLEVSYTHPTEIQVNSSNKLGLQLLYEGGLLGITIPIGFSTQQLPLAARWDDFDAKFNIAKNASELKWSTVSEINNSYFEVERSVNGSTYEYLGKIIGAGNSGFLNTYHFADENIYADGKYTYRLKQVDYDGKESYSKSVSVIVPGDKLIKTSIFPNPAYNEVNFSINAKDGAQVSIDILNSIGQNIISRSISEFISGRSTRYKFDCKDFGQGAYTVVFTIDGIRYNHKLIIVE
ncbi:MAG: hypothetical protein IPL55_06785 [Saprospiraceae bacterium]|nr:hypothetical protein [Saprospiraceae bacterium]